MDDRRSLVTMMVVSLLFGGAYLAYTIYLAPAEDEGARLEAEAGAAANGEGLLGLDMDGPAQHVVDPVERKTVTAAAADRLRAISTALSEIGLPPRIITGSGTGTHADDAGNPYNELQVGSYVFMDADYARIVDTAGAGPPFAPSLFVLTTVVSVNRPGEVTVDAGTKALAVNGPPPCHILGTADGADYRFAGDEHGIITVPRGAAEPELGARLLLGATHCDPTVNLYGRMHAWMDGRLRTWPVLGRYHGTPHSDV